MQAARSEHPAVEPEAGQPPVAKTLTSSSRSSATPTRGAISTADTHASWAGLDAIDYPTAGTANVFRTSVEGMRSYDQQPRGGMLASPENQARSTKSDSKETQPAQASLAEQVILANIVAAQNELDEAMAYVNGFSGASAKRPDVGAVEQKLVRATLYAAEARVSTAEATASSAAIAAALASIHGVEIRVDNFIHLRAAGADVAEAAGYRALYEGVWQRFLQHEGALMRVFGVPKQPSHVSTVGKGKDASKPEVAAIQASLLLAQRGAEQGFDQLVSHTGDPASRVSIIKSLAKLVQVHIHHAALMLTAFDDGQHKLLTPQVEATSSALLRVKRWMDGRQGNAAMVAAFAGVVTAINETRVSVGLGMIDREAVTEYPESEEAEEFTELGTMASAIAKYELAWHSIAKAMDEGVDQWFELAKVNDQRPSFGEDLLSALITAAVGNVAGFILGRLIISTGKHHVKQVLQELGAGVMSDASQAILGPALSAGLADAGSEPDLKALLFVRSGLKELVRKLESGHITKLQSMRADGQVSVADVEELDQCARAAQATAEQDMKIRAATDWARYVAQTSLRQKMIGTPDTVANERTDLTDYYKERSIAHEGRVITVNGADTAGMLQVTIWNYEESVAGQIGLPEFRDINLVDLNKDMTVLVVNNAATLDEVKVPKEVLIRYKISQGRTSYAHPWIKLAIDEAGRIVDSTIVLDDGVAPPDEGAQKWQEIRKLAIDKSKIT